jgi:hypothetical protein
VDAAKEKTNDQFTHRTRKIERKHTKCEVRWNEFVHVKLRKKPKSFTHLVGPREC